MSEYAYRNTFTENLIKERRHNVLVKRAQVRNTPNISQSTRIYSLTILYVLVEILFYVNVHVIEELYKNHVCERDTNIFVENNGNQYLNVALYVIFVVIVHGNTFSPSLLPLPLLKIVTALLIV